MITSNPKECNLPFFAIYVKKDISFPHFSKASLYVAESKLFIQSASATAVTSMTGWVELSITTFADSYAKFAC